jgi:hypothetical protein
MRLYRLDDSPGPIIWRAATSTHATPSSCGLRPTMPRDRSPSPEYRVEAVSDVYPGDKDDPTIWYAHNRVQRILEPTEPPADKVREEPTYKEQATVDGRKYWMDFPFSE